MFIRSGRFRVTMATPFDEESVDVIEGMGLDVIKIASCSAADWPLLKRVAEANRPVPAAVQTELVAAVASKKAS